MLDYVINHLSEHVINQQNLAVCLSFSLEQCLSNFVRNSSDDFRMQEVAVSRDVWSLRAEQKWELEV